ncbi:MAG: superoxide dismutase family protein [Ruminococcus sp.]|nr:superoxide dismutase family protein [Ruminococcus sp.]
MRYKINPGILLRKPCLTADICGSCLHSQINGRVSFFNACGGSVVTAEIFGLPTENNIFAMHIHNGSSCSGNETDPFANAGTHLDFTNTEHPFHTGDLPAIFSNNGYAWYAVYTNRFQPFQVKGYTVIVHAHSDDYHTQPSGNSGEKIACGVIK